jgi:photosystem II stability/assembly factor-like uncharacterized protein
MRSRVWRSCSLLATPLLVMILLSVGPANAPAQQAPPPELLATPQSGWLWSNPAPQGDDLEAVEFAGEIGFAAGEDGTVLKSVDGGASWIALSGGTTEKLSLLQVLDPATVFVSGELGLLESTDGGSSFKEIRSERPCYECSSISAFSFLSDTSGFIETYDIFTKSDSLLWTENDGASFEARTPIPLYEATPGQIRFLSSADGVALVSGQNIGRVMRTVDGARTWTIAAEGHHQLSAVTFATPLVGYAVGEDDTLLRSEDGGATWQTMPLQLPPGTETLDLTGISCADAESCLVTTTRTTANERGPVLRTTDGGRSATIVSPFDDYPGRPGVFAISYGQPNDAVAVGAAGATAASTNEGVSFTDDGWRMAEPFYELYEEPPTQLRLGRSPQDAYLPSMYGRIAATMNAGQSWNVLQLPTLRTILDASFPTPQRGFAIAKGGGIYTTSDGGHSWLRCGGAARSPGAVLAPSSRVVLVTGEHGIWRSTDGCRTFSDLKQELLVDGRPRSLQSLYLGEAQQVNRHTLIVFGAQILESMDAGKHWTLVPRPALQGSLFDGYLEAVSFLSARTGYVISDGILFFTSDQGRHWRQILTVAPEERAEYPSMSFTSVRDGFIATHNSENRSPSIIFRTEDGGRSWIPEEMPYPIATLAAAPGIAYSASTGAVDMFVARGGGYTGAPSRITLRIAGPATLSPRALARAHDNVTVRGSIDPPLSGARITIAQTTGHGGWSEESVETVAGGSFSHTFQEVESTSLFDAYWTGSPGYRGAAAGPVRLLVRR